jgi:plasmid stabilization system protein ParE
MKLTLHDAAEAELRAAARYYEAKLPGLGVDLIEEFARALERILTHPHAGSPARAGTRRQLLNRFPFGVYYLAEGSTVAILAVAHHSRRPGYWEKRR